MQFYDWNHETSRSSTDGYSRGVAIGRDLMMAHVELEEGAVTKAHRHVHEEIIYVVRGRWKLMIDGKERVLEANQSLIIPPNVEHASEALAPTLAVVSTNYRPEWQANSDCWLHYNVENHLWAV